MEKKAKTQKQTRKLDKIKPSIDLGITRDEFHALVRKAAQPVKPSESDSTSTETSESRPADDCSGKNTR